VCSEAEAATFFRDFVLDMEQVDPLPLAGSEAVAKAIVEAATTSEAVLIVTLTRTGTSPRLISKYRPRCPILVLSSDTHVGAACNLHRGCIPFYYPEAAGDDDKSDLGEDDQLTRMVYALHIGKATGLCKSGDRVLLAHGMKSGKSSLSHFSMIKLA